MKGRWHIGLIDAGTSSVATFIAGVVATRVLDTAELGMYAIFFSARILVSHLPTQLIFDPAEARLIAVPTVDRTAYFGWNTLIALPWAILGSLLVFVVLAFAPPGTDPQVALQLAGTAALVAFFVPIQSHARRLLHLSRRHWAAANASFIRLAIAAVATAVALGVGVHPGLIPFGALAVADLATLIYVFALVGLRRDRSLPYTMEELLKAGIWLLAAAVIGPASALLTTLIVGWIAGVEVVGISEAASIVASPVLVTAAGLAAVARPGSMEAAWRGDERGARALSRQQALGLGVLSLLYLGVLYLPENINFMYALVPKGFEIGGLVALSVLAAVVNGAILLQRSELIALRNTRQLSVAEAIASVARVAVGFGAAALLWWTVPLAFLTGGGVRWAGFARILSSRYGTEPQPATGGADSG